MEADDDDDNDDEQDVAAVYFWHIQRMWLRNLEYRSFVVIAGYHIEAQ